MHSEAWTQLESWLGRLQLHTASFPFSFLRSRFTEVTFWYEGDARVDRWEPHSLTAALLVCLAQGDVRYQEDSANSMPWLRGVRVEGVTHILTWPNGEPSPCAFGGFGAFGAFGFAWRAWLSRRLAELKLKWRPCREAERGPYSKRARNDLGDSQVLLVTC